MFTLKHRIFAGNEEDKKIDEELSKKLSKLKFLKPSHLELPELIDKNAHWEFAIEELKRMDNYKPPRDKLICITNCVKILMSILKKVTEGKFLINI